MLKGVEENFGKYVLIGILLILVFLSYKIISPYLIIILSSFVLAYMLFPLHKFLSKKINSNVSAIFCLVLVIAVFILPIAGVLAQIGNQTYEYIKSGQIDFLLSRIDSFAFLKNIGLNIDLQDLNTKIFSFILSMVGSIISQIPSMVVSLFIFVFSFYYILLNWENVSHKLKNFIPFKNKEKIAREIDRSTRGIIFGYLLIAIIEFIISGVVLYLAGVKLFLLLAFLIAILVFIPGLSSIVVLLPLLIYNFLIKNWIGFAIILILGFVLIVLIEFLLTTALLGKKSRIHPLLMLLGIFGGTAIFGLFGFILGPIILVYTLKIIEGAISNN